MSALTIDFEVDALTEFVEGLKFFAYGPKLFLHFKYFYKLRLQ